MCKPNIIKYCLTLLLTFVVAGNLLAHTTVLPKTTLDEYYQRTEPDGVSSVVNDFAIPHGCDGAPVVASSMLFPNGEHVVVEDQDGNAVNEAVFFEALEELNNVIMGPKPAQNANWKKIEVVMGPVRTYYSHGIKAEDVRAFHYSGGNLPNEYLGLLPWWASFAGIRDDSCVKEIMMRIPIVNYCQRNPNSPTRLDAWIGRTTAAFSDPTVVSVGFWPGLTIVNTHFDEGECGEGVILKVSPTDEDIDTLLIIKSFKP